MNNEQKVLLKLISQSQFGLTATISFTDVNMDYLYEEAVQQSVLGLIAPEIPFELSSAKWTEATYRSKASYILYCNAQDELKEVLDAVDIPFIILKGNAAAINYKDPSRRTMGDIDFLVPPNYYDSAKKLLLKSGFIWDHKTTRHDSFKKNNYVYELHSQFSQDVDIEEYIISSLNNQVSKTIDGFSFCMLPRLANGLVLLDHFRQHLRASIGLRHAIDWMMFVYCNLDDDFWFSTFQSVVIDKKLELLAIHLTRMCQLYLGLPDTITWCKSADENICNKLISVLLESGNFGHKNARGANIESVSTSIKRKGFFTWLQFAGESNWKTYHMHHWLRPFCWFYQICRYVKQGIDTGRNINELKGDYKRSNARFELLRKLDIS